MEKGKLRTREERKAYMARRHLRAGKPIPKIKKVRRYYRIDETQGGYKHGVFARIRHFIGNIFIRYPTVVAAGILASGAYFCFREANAVTQWAGGLALSALVAANPELASKIISKTHQYMTYGVETTGEAMSNRGYQEK